MIHEDADQFQAVTQLGTEVAVLAYFRRGAELGLGDVVIGQESGGPIVTPDLD